MNEWPIQVQYAFPCIDWPQFSSFAPHPFVFKE